MSRQFDRLVERQILKARAEGKLDGLDGEGKPLPDHPEAALADPATAAGLRIMAEAGVLPEEITLKKAMDAARVAYARLTDADADTKKAAMAEIARLELKRAIAVEARRKFLR